jgi:hypothetical protein
MTTARIVVQKKLQLELKQKTPMDKQIYKAAFRARMIFKPTYNQHHVQNKQWQ